MEHAAARGGHSANSVFVTTAYIESTEYGFPCTDDSTVDAETCTVKTGTGSTLEKYTGGQCVCKSATKTYYPLGAEEMEVSFQHFYNTPTITSGNQISGGSDKADAENPLKTTFVMANGTEMKWDPPGEITIPLRDLLLGAEHASCQSGSAADLRDGKDDGKCATGIHLDEPNVDVRAELSGDDTKAHYPVAVARIEPRGRVVRLCRHSAGPAWLQYKAGDVSARTSIVRHPDSYRPVLGHRLPQQKTSAEKATIS